MSVCHTSVCMLTVVDDWPFVALDWTDEPAVVEDNMAAATVGPGVTASAWLAIVSSSLMLLLMNCRAWAQGCHTFRAKQLLWHRQHVV